MSDTGILTPKPNETKAPAEGTAQNTEQKEGTDAPKTTETQSTEEQPKQQQDNAMPPKEGEPGTKPPDEAKAQESTEEVSITVPQGLEADKALLDEFVALAKESGLKRDAAQKVADIYFKTQTQRVEQSQKAREEYREKLVEAARTDKEIGGEGFDHKCATARKALAEFGDPDLHKLLDDPLYPELSNHPALIRFCYRVGKMLGEDSVAGTTRGTVQQSQDPLERLSRTLYPTMHKES